MITSTLVGAVGAVEGGDLPDDLPDPPEEVPEGPPEGLPDEVLELVPDPDTIRESDTTDAYATVIGMGSSEAVTQVAEDGTFTFTIEVYHYEQDEEDLRVDLSEREGETAILRFADHRILPDLAYDCEEPVQPGHLNVCGTIGDDTFALSEDARQLTVTVAPGDLDDAELLGQPIGISAFIDVTDESGGPLGNYEAGNGAYNVAKLQVKETPLASALDNVITPVALFGEDPTQVNLIEILEPTEGASVVPGGVLHVTWRAPANDLQQGAYRVEATAVNGGDSTSTTDYVCSGIAGSDQVRCTTKGLGTPLQLTDAEGPWNVLVHMPSDEHMDPGDAKLLCGLDPGIGACDTAQIEVGSITELRTTPETPDGEGDWFTSEVELEIKCTAAAGCDRIQYRVDGGDAVIYETPFTVSDGTHTISYQGVDAFGNTEPVQEESLQQDTQPPATSQAISPADPDGENGWYVTAPTVSLEGSDATSGCQATVHAIDGGQETRETDCQAEVTFDGDGTFELAYHSEDNAGLVEASQTVSIQQDLNAPTISELCPLDGETCLDAGSTLTDPTLTVRLDASDTGSGLSTQEVWAENTETGETTERVSVTDGTAKLETEAILDEPFENVFAGTVALHASVTDVAGHEALEVTESFEVNTNPDPTIRVTLKNDPNTFLPNEQTVSLTYKAIWIGGDEVGDPAAGETIELTDANDAAFSKTATTGLNGLVTFELGGSDIQRELTVDVTSTDVDLDLPDPLTITWTALEILRVQEEDTPRTTTWANPGETYSVAYEVRTTWNDSALKDAQVTLTDGDGGTESAFTDKNGIAEVPVERMAPAEVTFTSEASYNPDDGPNQQVIGTDATIRWAEVDVDLTNDGLWHNVTDIVTFEVTADLDYGEATEPADGATVEIEAGGVTKTAELDENGHGSVEFTFEDVTVTTPTVTSVETPEGITTFVQQTSELHRWTEIVLTPSTGDGFVNVGDDITVDLEAHWAHDEDGNGELDDAVASATVAIQALSDDADLGTCGLTDGVGSCTVNRDIVDDGGLTFEVTASSQDVTRQADGTPATLDAVWTQIVVSELTVADTFVNVGDTVEVTGTATYAHDGSDVPSGQLALDGAPAACSAGAEEEITEGTVRLNVTCTEVVDQALDLTVTSAHEAVTLLESTPTFSATWTELLVSYTTEDANGDALASGSLLDHNDPVRFRGEIQFSHLADGDGTAPPEDTILSLVVKDGEDRFNCIFDHGVETECVADISKDEGEHTFDVTAESLAPGDDGLFDVDISRVVSTPAPSTFRWTSIGFEAFECEGTASGVQGCQEAFIAGEKVTVTVTAVAKDTGTTLAGAEVTIGGQTYTTDEDGKASRSFFQSTQECVNVTARGVTATIDGQTVDWDTPRTEEICWS